MKSTNVILRRTAVALERAGKERDSPVWSVASELLSKPASLKVEVNVGRLSRVADDGATVLVPGKVLGAGELDKKLTVGAFAFSASAKQKIVSKGGKALTIDELLKKNPEGRGVKIVR